jgi:hypothetical protein
MRYLTPKLFHIGIFTCIPDEIFMDNYVELDERYFVLLA